MLWDPIRAIWVALTPEEEVRQQWIRRMIEELEYPKGLLSVEKELSSFDSLAGERRIDLLCWRVGKEGLLPLLIVEFKRDGSLEGAKRQVFGYNESVKAPFLSVASRDQIHTFWKEQGGFTSVPFLPSYQQLIETL